MASWRDTPPDSTHVWEPERKAREDRTVLGMIADQALEPLRFEDDAPDVPRLVDPATLIGASDVLALCGWKQRKSIHDARARAFPEPVAVVSGMRLWVRADVERWQAAQA